MRRPMQLAIGVAALAVVAVSGTALAGGGGGASRDVPLGRGAEKSTPTSPALGSQRARLAKATMIVEVNATDGDAGLQVFLDGDPWRSMTISSPDGRLLIDIDAAGRLRDFGLTELFSESSEPPFDRFPLAKFKKLFPEGTYAFAGTTVDGERVVGKAKLSHDIPGGPKITAPEDGEEVPRDNLVARWNPPRQRRGIDVVGYRVILERERPLRVLSVDLPASAASVTVPSQFLRSGIEYKLEVQAIEASGNQTLTEITFRVE